LAQLKRKNEKLKRGKYWRSFLLREKVPELSSGHEFLNGMPEQETPAGLSLTAKIFIALGIFVVAAPILYVAAVMIAMKAHLKEDCGRSLRVNLGVRLREHAEKYEGRFPNNWSELEWDDMGGITNTTWDRLFACPTVGHGAGDWKQVDYWTDYRLIPGRTTNDQIDTVLAIEPLSNHETGANVLFVDGSSQWWPAKRVLGEKALLQSTNK
jgi:prepilin-type processing-associated H-X9-DG protein